jgi:hypothetical protein
MTFKTLLRKLQKKHYASTVAFAQALGIKDPSRLSRGQPWDVYWCLRLAQVTGEHPSIILRAANKGVIASLIEDLYGEGRRLHTPEQQALLEALDAIRDPAVRKALITIARNAAGIDGGAQGGTEDGGPLIPPQTNKDPDYKMAR